MVTLYGVYRSRMLRCVWLCEEAGLAYRVVPVLQDFRPIAQGTMHSRSPEYLRINPNGGIPALEDDGLVMSESLAINLYLARKAGAPIGPADAREDGQILQWTLFAATQIEPRASRILFNRVQLPPAQRSEARVAKAVAELRTPFAALEAALAATGYLVGGRFTAADINMAETVRYALPAPEAFEGAPRVKDWLAACQARPAYRTILARREEEPPLG